MDSLLILRALNDQRVLLFLEFGPFASHDDTEQLIGQALVCDHEIQQSDLKFGKDSRKISEK